METLHASEILAALGHEARLATFRLLVETGPRGLNAGEIAEQLGIAPAALSFHLAHLARVKLVSSRRRGRFVRYSAGFATMDQLLAFLTHNCCQGRACLPRATATRRGAWVAAARRKQA